jgi:hypothetical protein
MLCCFQAARAVSENKETDDDQYDGQYYFHFGVLFPNETPLTYWVFDQGQANNLTSHSLLLANPLCQAP